MARQQNSPISLVAGEDLVAFRRVMLSGATVVYADRGDKGIGVVQNGVASGSPASIRADWCEGTSKMMAAGSFSAGADLYVADDGKVDDLPFGPSIGQALEAATADGDIVEVLPAAASIDYQGLHEASDDQLHPLGFKRVLDDGRTFRYAKAGTAGVIPNMGAKFTPATILSEAVHLDAAIGAVTFVMDEAGITANRWAGGFVVFHTAAGTQQNRRIVSNTASAASTNHVTVTIDEPLTTALVGTTTLAEIMASPWSSLEYTTSERASHAGVPACVATVGQFFWVQTAGPVWVTPGGGTTPGDSDQDRTVYWVGDGSVNGGAHLTYAGSSYQKAGFIIDNTSAGGPPFIWLTME